MNDGTTAPAAPAAEPTSTPAVSDTPARITTDALGSALTEQLKPAPVRERAPDGKFRKKEAEAPEVEARNAAQAAPAEEETPAAEAAPEQPETAADDGAEPEIEITEEGEETSETPPSKVEAPSSWPAELRTVFAELKPDAQQKLRAWQEERDRGIDRTVNEAKESARKALESLDNDKKAMQYERDHLQAAVEHYANPKIAKYRADFADLLSGKITETQLVQDQAVRYAADGTDRWELYQAYNTEFAGIERAITRAREKNEAERATEFNKFRETENGKYREAHKLTDDAAWDAHTEELHKFGEGRGYKASELAYADSRHMTDLRELMEGRRSLDSYTTEAKKLGFTEADLNMAQDAIRYRKALAARKSVEANPNQPIVPKVARPGVHIQQPSTETKKVAALKTQFNNSGKVDDLAKLINIASG